MTTKAMLASAAVVLGMTVLAMPAVGQTDMDDMGFGGMRGFGGGMMPDFAELDADSDGRITEAEMRAHRAAQVEGIDADNNGMISEAELVSHMTARMAARVQTMASARMAAQDVDGDGQLSAEELIMPPMPARLFARADADGDGAVTEDEMDAAHARMRDRDGRGPRMRGGRRADDGE